MRMNLAKLLQDQSVGHPSRIVATTLEDRELRVRVVGWPWWSDRADRGGDHGIEFIFGGVSDGVLELLDFESEYDEALEPFSCVETVDLSWAQPQGSAIYCNVPLPRPLDVHLAVHEFLALQGAFRRPAHYLNCDDTDLLAPFIRVTQSSSYLLGRFPPLLRDVVCVELDAQKVSYTELPIVFEKPGQFLVTIQRSQFFCETAEALFDG